MVSNLFLKRYLSNFNTINYNDFLALLNYFFKETYLDNIHEKLEFSLQINKLKSLNLRFGLFKIYNTELLKSFFIKKDFSFEEINSLINIMKDFTPEYALGIDTDSDNFKFKLYFLRLPDNPQFNKKILFNIQSLCKILNIKNILFPNSEECYLIAIDFYKNKKRNIKIYTHTSSVSFSETTAFLKRNGFTSKYLDILTNIFKEEDFGDTTYSFKFNNKKRGLIGFSIFFQIEKELNRKIYDFFMNCFPSRFNELNKIFSSLEDNNYFINYTQFGITFDLESNEDITIYYSPKLRGSIR